MEVKFMIDEAGFVCIGQIKAQLKRLGWLNPYDEQQLQRINLSKFRDISVVDIYLDNEDVKMIYYQHVRNSQTLKAMLIAEKVSVDLLYEILLELEQISCNKLG